MDNDPTVAGGFHELNASFIGLKKRATAITSRSQIFYYAGNDNSCLTCFLSIRLEQTARGGDSAMKVLWTYPYSPSSVLAQYPNIGKFALANAGTSYSAERLTYTFVLTDAQGVREYGHCTAYVNGEAVVCISPYPWCNFFYRVAYLYRCNGPEDGQRVVKALCRCATPPSGAGFLVPLDLGVSFRRPYDRLCSFIDTSPLDMLVTFPKTDDLFSVLSALLLEKHTIIAGPNFAVVSNVVMSLQALIAPFDWMHILIPILPTSLLDVLAAPPPFLIGILTSQLPLVNAIPVESVVVVRLNRWGICERVQHFNEVADILPHSGRLSALRVGLTLLRLRDPRDQTVRDLCSLFMTYYATIFGEVVLRGAKGYIKSHELTPRNVTFYEKLLSTQSFNILSEEVSKLLQANNMEWMDNEFVVAAVRSHKEVYPDQYAQLIEEEKQGGGYLEKYEDCFGSREDFNSVTAAIHGFGGHQMSLFRLLGHCMCGRWCSPDDDNTDAFYPDMLRSRFASGRNVVIVADELPSSAVEMEVTPSPSSTTAQPVAQLEFTVLQTTPTAPQSPSNARE